MNLIRKIKRLFSKGEKKRVNAEIILTEKESLEMGRKERQERFAKWLNEHKQST